MSLEDTTAAPAPAESAPAPAPAPEAAPAPAAPDRAADAAASETALNDDLRSVYRNANKLRAEDGKFAADPSKTPPAPAIDMPAEVKTEAPATDKTVEAAPITPPPRSWAKEAAAKWKDVPPDVQSYIHQREVEAARAISELGKSSKAMEPIRSVIEQNIDVFRRNGTTPDQGIAALISAQNALDTNPINGIAFLAQTYGVDLRAVVAQMYPDQSGLPPDPEVSQLRNELAQLKREQEFARSQQTAREQAAIEAQRQAQVQSFQQQIETFAADKPHFDQVSGEVLANINALMQASPGLSVQDVLQQAYDRAIWANPETRKAHLDAEHARRLQEAAKAAAEAKRASSINVRGAPRAQTGPQDIDADLRAVWRRSQQH